MSQGVSTALPAADYYDVEALLFPREREKLAELREFLAAEVAPHAQGWWDREEFPFELVPKLGALGLSAPHRPLPHRPPYSRLFQGLVIAELTRADTSIATFFMVHHDLFVEGLCEFGSPEQRERYLADASALCTTGAFALTEPEHGSDVAGGLSLTARRVRAGGQDGRDGAEDVWVLDGAKRWIGNGTFADHVLVWARDVSAPDPRRAVRGFIVAGDSAGLTRTRIEHKIALRTVQNADLVFDGVRVAEADRFPGIATFDDARTMLLGSRLLVAWQAVGQQLAAFDVARQYAVERLQFGRPVASFQLIQAQLTQMLGNATASMAMLAQLARLQDAGEATMPRVALAKAWATARMRETVALGRGILGGNGIVTDYRMAKIFADAEAVYTYEGTFEVNTLIAGRDITGVSAIR